MRRTARKTKRDSHYKYESVCVCVCSCLCVCVYKKKSISIIHFRQKCLYMRCGVCVATIRREEKDEFEEKEQQDYPGLRSTTLVFFEYENIKESEESFEGAGRRFVVVSVLVSWLVGVRSSLQSTDQLLQTLGGHRLGSLQGQTKGAIPHKGGHHTERSGYAKQDSVV